MRLPPLLFGYFLFMKYTLEQRQGQVDTAYDKFISENPNYSGKIECHFSGIHGEIVTIQKHENI